MFYNVKRKIYPDGTVQLTICDKLKQRDFETVENEYSNKKKTGKTVKRKEIDNQKRARQKVYDLCRSNIFNYFVTMTLSDEFCDRYDYDSCRDVVKHFTKWLTENECQYVIVPEQHEDGAYHFHGLINGKLKLTQAYNSKTGKKINGVYNITNYNYGFTTVSRVKDNARVSTYITKYLTKELSVPKGKKRYWSSTGLKKPVETYHIYKNVGAHIGDMKAKATFIKDIPTEYGNYTLLEYKTSIEVENENKRYIE